MTETTKRYRSWPGDILALFSGAVVPLSFAPYDLWIFGVLASGILAINLRGLSPLRAWLRSLAFGIGMFGTGVSWVYISIHDFGSAPALLAGVMTAAFVGFVAFVFSAPFYFYQRFIGHTRFGLLLGFPAIWVLGEWSRSWFLTGFPWLYLGYGHIDTWLAGWGPIAGVYGISFIAVFSGLALVLLQRDLEWRLLKKRKHNPVGTHCTGCALLVAALFWLGGLTLNDIEWTSADAGEPLSVVIVQPNIPLALKWNPLYRVPIMRTLRELSDAHWERDLIVWPEAAIPLMYHEASDFIAEMEAKATEHNTALVTGILFDDLDAGTYYNSIMGIGAAKHIYFKQRLVPFGEYVPLEKQLRGLIEFFNLPNSVISPGPNTQQGLAIGDFAMAPYICYEIVYPDLVANNLADARLMITISNDAWFGDSIGPLQHFQMARMRALENGRYLIRGTNTGLSGIISNKGEVLLSGNQFISQALVGTVPLMHGQTPYNRTGSIPLILFCALVLAVGAIIKKK